MIMFKSFFSLHSRFGAFLVIMFLPFLTQCQQGRFGGYDLDAPHVIKLEKALHEVSGIEIVNNSIYAIGDDKGVLYELNIESGKVISEWKFNKSRDYEGLAYHNGKFYVLNSNGDVYEVELRGSSEPVVTEHKFELEKGMEFEIFYYDDSLRKMVMICKECSVDKKSTVSAYSFDPGTGSFEKAGFSLDAEAIAKARGNKKVERIKASGGSIHPITGDLYIVSSINKMLMVSDRQGRPHSIFDLNRKLFEQPEGVAFTPNGDLYISNEKGGKSAATIVVYRYRK
jgi:uncharacterized protein YjiK